MNEGDLKTDKKGDQEVFQKMALEEVNNYIDAHRRYTDMKIALEKTGTDGPMPSVLIDRGRSG